MTYDALCAHFQLLIDDILAYNTARWRQVPPELRAQEAIRRSRFSDVFFFDTEADTPGLGNQVYDFAMAQQASDSPFIKVKPHEAYGEPFTHRHEFIELNYMLSGTCTQQVEDRTYTLRAGDLLAMDMQTHHSVSITDRQSILINILLLPQQAEQFLQTLLPDSSPLNVFVVQAAYRLSRVPNHLLFHMQDCAAFQDTMFHFLCECYFPRDASNTTLLVGYLRILFALLSQELSLNPQGVDCAYAPESRIGPIVQYIKEHCRTCTRDEVARQFGYTKTYISILLKQYTGQTFLDLRNGFQNSSYFYRLYKQRYGVTPRQRISPS